MSGVVTISVEEGDEIDEGRQVATIEAMKMESAVRALKNGKVKRSAVTSGSSVEPGDLLIVLELEQCAIE
jgi:pyruvate carboxylase